MGPTNIVTGAQQALLAQSVGIWTATMHRQTNLNRLAGDFPKQSEAETHLRNQTSSSYPIVRSRDLSKMAGDQVLFDFMNPTGGKPIMAGKMASGRGAQMVFDGNRLRIDQSRYPVSAGDKMAQQRTKWELRKLAVAQSYGYMSRLSDQRELIHLCGSRGFQNTIEWAVPLASDPDFSSIMINPVLAPSNNRHYMVSGGYLVPFAASGNVVTIQTTDQITMSIIDSLASLLDELPLAPAPCVFKGDVMALDSPIRVLMVSPRSYSQFASQAAFRTLQAQAYQRAAAGKDLAVFKGEVGLFNNILIMKMPRPIRFYAGQPINHCATANSTTETTTDLVNASFGTTYAVDRSILLGAQALAEAFGKNQGTGVPFFFEEEEKDFKDKLEVMCGLVDGMSKVRFNVNFQGNIGTLPTDIGVIAIDSAVSIPSLVV